MKQCPKCKATIEDNAKFCTKCGTNLQQYSELSLSTEDSNKEEKTDLNCLSNCETASSEDDNPENSLNMLALSQSLDLRLKKKNDLAKARVLCIRGQYSDAQAIYDDLIDKNPEDIDGYMGLIRIATHNYSNSSLNGSEEIDNSIRIAQQIIRKDDLSEFDDDYAKYIVKRNEYVEELEREPKERRERINKLLEDANYKLKEQQEKPPIIEGNHVLFGLWPDYAKDITLLIDSPVPSIDFRTFQ